MSYPSKKAQRLPRRGRGAPTRADVAEKTKATKLTGGLERSDIDNADRFAGEAGLRAEPPASGAVKSFGGESRKRFGAKRQNERAEIDREKKKKEYNYPLH